MSKGTTIGIVLGLAALGAGAYFLLSKPQEKPDPLAMALDAATPAINAATNIIKGAPNAIGSTFKGATSLITGSSSNIGVGQKLVESLKKK